jgi:hypothetical protein
VRERITGRSHGGGGGGVIVRGRFVGAVWLCAFRDGLSGEWNNGTV